MIKGNIMIIYKTTNLINGKFYIGKDSKNDPNYLGSGKILKKAFKRYGIENFKKEIIEECTSEDHLNERERYWITFLLCRERDDCYNIGEGGIGGDNITYHPNRPDFIEKMKLINSTQNGMTGKKHKESSYAKMKERAVGRYGKQWYIDRYGEDEGLKKYEARNANLKTNRLTSGNPAYIHIEKDDLINYIIENPDCKMSEMEKYLNVGSTCLYGKFKLYFDCKTLKDVKLQVIC